MENTQGGIVLFDGVCNFCNGAVNFIIAHDPKGIYTFASLQSTYAHELLKSQGITLTEPYDTFLVYAHGKLYDKSDAALYVARNLSGFWRYLSYFKIIPKSVRDFFYSLIARNRYKLFGKKESCMLPSSEVRGRFLG